MSDRTKRRPLPLLGALVLAVLLALSLANYKVVADPLYALLKREITFTDFVGQVQKGCTADSFTSKNIFVDLNGLFARLTGRRVLNDVVRCEGGMLSQAYSRFSTAGLAQEVTALSTYLQEYEDIPFLYIQAPYKEDLEGRFFPQGVPSYANQSADELLDALRGGGVRALDLRPMMSRTVQMLQQNFYRTDHHWTPNAAFTAFQEIAAQIKLLFPDQAENIPAALTQRENWEEHRLADWFLGSWGKRVGRFFGGTDELIWLTPTFGTQMSCAIPHQGALYRGDFVQANLRTQYIDRRDFFGYNAYCVYIGRDYPLVQHRNLSAPCPLRVLVIKDSFTLPLQAFLSTVFQEVDVLDPRHSLECTPAQYIQRTQPDLVLMMLNPSTFSHKGYRELGAQQAMEFHAAQASYEEVYRQDIILEAIEDNRYHYAPVPLEQGCTYTLRFSGVDLLEGEPQGVSVCVYDLASRTRVSSRLFDLDYCARTDSFFWTFDVPKVDGGNLKLLFYAGALGSTGGNSVAYRDVVLEKHILP